MRHADAVVDVVGEEEHWTVVVDVRDPDGDLDGGGEGGTPVVVGDDRELVTGDRKELERMRVGGV